MSDLEPIQRSRLGEIGQLLAKAREEKGLTLEEVSGKTLIRAAILKAIEEGDARPLPEPVYIRGFIRRFGDLVGLNGMELCDSFPWQPSGSVPLSFVSAGNIVAANPESQKSVEAVAPAAPEPKVEPSPVETPAAPELDAVSPVDLAAVAESDVDAPLDAPLAKSGGEIETPDNADVLAPESVEVEASAEVETPQADVSSAQEALEEQASVLESATPDHEAAYESRAALFGDGSEESDGVAAAAVTGGAAAIASTMPAVASQSSIDNGEAATVSGESSAASAATGTGVATLPPPPAPVMYREPEQRNLMPWILALVAGVVGLGIAVLAFGGGNRQTAPGVANDPAPLEQAETDAAEGTATPPSGSEDATESAAPTPPPASVPADKVVLELEVKGAEEAWIDVRVDGEVKIDGNAGNQLPGFKQRLEGSQEIDFATARPDLVWISVNGGEPKAFGEVPAVKAEIFKPANAQ